MPTWNGPGRPFAGGRWRANVSSLARHHGVQLMFARLFATQFGSQAKPIRELVSFHLDSDKKWRLSGYAVR